jgi:putative flippase GtrA
MALTLEALKERALSPTGVKAFRYVVVSAVAVAVHQVSLFVLFRGFHWTARSANILAFCLGTIPSYYLNRRWTWGRTHRSHLLKEVLPFWAVALASLLFSTVAADFAERAADDVASSRSVQGLIINAASLATLGLVWSAKFVFFNKVLFVDRGQHGDHDEAPEVGGGGD